MRAVVGQAATTLRTTTLTATRALAIVVNVVAVLAYGCGGSQAKPVANPVVALVAEGPANLSEVDLSAPGQLTRVPSDRLGSIAPLLSDRALTNPEGLSSYGLDQPRATLHYHVAGGPTVDIELGQPDFDRHFIYAQRAGDGRVFLLPAGPLRPLLALVGIQVAPPT
jgi:hypothetical protein